ncbi:MAG: hypothetical protein HY935_01610 [Nitrosomonadales bacterium]|nr:hypothetical protein [Nitrosomonadales bacterium]
MSGFYKTSEQEKASNIQVTLTASSTRGGYTCSAVLAERKYVAAFPDNMHKMLLKVDQSMSEILSVFVRLGTGNHAVFVKLNQGKC